MRSWSCPSADLTIKQECNLFKNDTGIVFSGSSRFESCPEYGENSIGSGGCLLRIDWSIERSKNSSMCRIYRDDYDEVSWERWTMSGRNNPQYVVSAESI